MTLCRILPSRLPASARRVLTPHWPAVLILALFLLLGGIYSLVNPLFESPDEVWHYEYVRWLIEGHGLPTPEEVGTAPWHQEGSQPPLYYLMAAALTAPIPTNNASQVIRYNPFAALGEPDSFGNKNAVLHGPAEDWPWQGVVLSAHLIRFLSLLLGALVVLSTYGTARLLFPGRAALAALAAALVAFNPQFLFISASINNDTLVTAASAAGVWLIVYLVVKADAPKWWQLILLGLLVAAAALGKLSGLALAGLGGLGLVFLAARRRAPLALLRWGVIVGVTALCAAGWWFWRNWQLYGDPLGLKAMFNVLPQRAEAPTLSELLGRSEGIWRSVWGVFGWFNVQADTWFYNLYSALALIALAGLVLVAAARYFGSRRARARRRVQGQKATGFRPGIDLIAARGLVVVWIIVIFLALVFWAGMRYPQGRLLFPAISAVAIIIGWGLVNWTPTRLASAAAGLLSTGLLLVALLAPWLWIAPAYASPQLLPASAPVPNPVAVVFGQQIRLVGYQLNESELSPGDTLHLTLYWQALLKPVTDYSVFVHLIDDVGILSGQADSYPGAGMAPTSEWPVGPILVDHYQVEIPNMPWAPTHLSVHVGLYELGTGERLQTGEGDNWTIGQVMLQPNPSEDGIFNPVMINFDNQIALVGFRMKPETLRPGDALKVELWWKRLKTPRDDYKVFVHLLSSPPEEAVVAQVDRAPNGPPTSLWKPNQVIDDRYKLTVPADVPPGIFSVEIGVYDLETGRLPVDLSDAGIILGKVRVMD